MGVWSRSLMNHLSKQFPKIAVRWVGVVLLALVSMVVPSKLMAQGYGSITGTVTDATGATVPGATVTVTQTGTGRTSTATTNSTGSFTFSTLPPAAYSLTVTGNGFKSYQQSGITLQADQALNVDAKLAVGATNETVEVTTAPPQVDVTTGTMQEVIDEQRVVDLPLNGRNAASLITLVAGVVDATNEGNGANQGNGKTFPAAVITSVNGTLPSQSNYLLDGGNNVDEMTNVNAPFPFPDALQEFSVQTSNYNAQYGQAAGGVVNIVTKSGTQHFHGSAFEFLRNGYFNAKPYFGTTPDNLHRHQFGGTIGGPVKIPGVSKGKSTQFFFGYQHTLSHASSTANQAVVPTLAEEGLTASGGQLGYADYGNLCTSGFNATTHLCNTATQQITNPFTNQAYALNRIPSAAFDPASVAYANAFPTFSGTELPGVIGGVVNYSKPTNQTFDEYVARVDHDFGSHDHLFGRYYYDWYTQDGIYDPKNLLSYQSYFNTRYQNALLSETHTFTNNLLNSIVINYQREVALRGGPPGSPLITDFGVKNIWQPNTGPFLSATVTGYFGASSSAFAAWGRNNYTFNDDVHWVKGSHNFGFGGHIELSKFDVTNVFQSYGAFGFGTATNTIGATTFRYPNAAANFMMGFMTSFQQGNYELVNDRNHFPGLYAQDSWKATSRLQLNYGIRWEAFAPWANKVGVQTQFNPAAYSANRKTGLYNNLPAGLLLSGDQGIPFNGVDNKYTQFMPRLGFALDVLGDGKMSIRGGYGMFFQSRIPGFFNLSQASFVPNTISVALTNPGMAGATAGANPGGPFSNPYCTGCAVAAVTNPFPFTLPFPANQTFPTGIQVGEYDPSGNFRVPITNDFNLILERQLASTWSGRVAYVGSTSRHQFVNLELNPSVNNGSGLSANARRPYNTAPAVGPCAVGGPCNSSYAQIFEASMTGNSSFHSLQTTLEKKMRRGLSLLLNYTWSKSVDDMPQATRVSNTADLNAGESYVYPLYPSNATGIPAAAIVPDIKGLDRGLSDIDHPHVLSVSYVWMLPKLHSSSKALNFVANGWRTTGLVQHHSGDSLTAYAGSDQSLTGLGQDRAQKDPTKSAYVRDGGTSACTPGKSCVAWFNKAAFGVPVSAGAGTGFGNVVKGSLRGPGYTNWDAGVIRSFPLFREINLDFRAEYFNLLNHTELGNPTTANLAANSATFGTISSTQGNARTGQFSMKLTF
jgi:hypothetical protein